MEVAAVSRGGQSRGEREREKSRERHQHPTPGLCWGRLAKFTYVACLFVVSWFFFFLPFHSLI